MPLDLGRLLGLVTAEPLPERDNAAVTERADSVLRRLDWQVIRRLDGILQGNHRSLFTGHGLDLAEIREYQPGDDVRYMDWNVTARLGEPFVRQYLEDREITAWLLLDLSFSVDYGTALATKRDLLVSFAGVISRLLTRDGNRVGALYFSRHVDRVLPPGQGRRQALTVVHNILRRDRTATRDTTDLAGVLGHAAEAIRKRSLLFIVSDFIAEPGWEPVLARLSRRHEVVAVWLVDPREEELPDIGPVVMEDAETGEQIYVPTQDRRVRERFRELALQRQRTLEASFSRHGIELIRLSTSDDLVRELSRYALRRREARRRQVSPVRRATEVTQ
jgi:uncharacterized protein (DUF58 family)